MVVLTLSHCTTCLLTVVILISSMFQLMSSFITIKQSNFILRNKGVVAPSSKVNSINIHRLYLTTNIIVVGKKGSVEDWIQSGYNEYEKRLKPTMNIQTVFIKSDDELLSYVVTNKNKLGTIY